MDLLSFISKTVESLAWPVSVVIIVVFLRKEMGNLISKITRIRHNDTEVEFKHELAAAKKEAERALPESQPKLPLPSHTEKLAELSPRGAIIEAWLKIEEALLKYASRHGIEVNKNQVFRVRDLEFHSLDYGGIGKGLLEMLERLRRTRNEAVHLSDLQIEKISALEYAEMASRVVHRLEEA